MTATASRAPVTAGRNELPPHLDENLLTPRFYTTEFKKAAKTDLEIARKDFDAIYKEMEADYNLKHFDRKASLERLNDLSPEDKAVYESYLVRSVVSEFSGFLLFKEISNRFKKAGRTELGEFFKLLARDEARHAGFLGRALKAEGINVDLPNLPKKRSATFFPLSWVLYSLYLSEKIGYWRYILINRHLKAHPEKACAPLFDFFEPWCQDENRHGDCINMMMRCWPGMTKGLRGKMLSRFFLWTVFLTHTLTVCERGDFYKLLGIDPVLFDEEVIIQTNNTSKNSFPWVYKFEDGKFLKMRLQILDAFRAWRESSGLAKPAALARFISLILRQFALPMEKTNALRYG